MAETRRYATLGPSSVSGLKSAATSFLNPSVCIEAIDSLIYEKFPDDPSIFPHIFDVVKAWLKRDPSLERMNEFTTQIVCVDAITIVLSLKLAVPNVSWMVRRFEATKALWPVISRWCMRVFECVIASSRSHTVPDRPVSVQQIFEAIARLYENLTRAEFDSSGYFYRCFASPSFIKHLLQVWGRTASTPKYLNAFHAISPVPFALHRAYLQIYDGAESASVAMEVFDAVSKADVKSCLQSLLLADPQSTSDRLSTVFRFLAYGSSASSVFRRALLSHRSLYWAMRSFKRLVHDCWRAPHRDPEGPIKHSVACMLYIGTIYDLEGRRWIEEGLKMRLLDCLWRCDVLFKPYDWGDRYNKYIARIIRILAVYAIHPVIVVELRDSIERLSDDLELDESSDRDLDNAWVLLFKEVETTEAMMSEVDKEMYRHCALSTCAESGARQVCTGCKQVLYCSQECQKRDWQSHRQMCAMFSEKYACAEPTMPLSDTRNWEPLYIGAMLDATLIESSQRADYVQFIQDYVKQNPEFEGAQNLGCTVDFSCAPRRTEVFLVDKNDRWASKLAEEGKVVIQWKIPWVGCGEESCMKTLSAFRP